FFRYAIEKMCKEKKSLNHFCIISLHLVISLMDKFVEMYVLLVMQSKFFFFHFSMKSKGIK
ncbi:hypothetical protein DW653_10605, partial [Phocaeicola plebeius]